MRKVGYNYEVKVVDVDGNGYDDLYVTGGYARKIKDFVLLQDASGNFSINKNPSSAYKSAAANVVVSENISVIRKDYNGDALYDFQIFNIDEEIENAPDLIVTTTFGTGEEPIKVVPMDQKFFDLLFKIEDTYEYAPTYLDLYHNNLYACYSWYVPFYVYDPYYDRWVIQWWLYTECEYGRNFLQRNLTPDHMTFVKSLAAMDNRYGLNSLQAPSVLYDDIMSSVDPRKVLESVTDLRRTVRWVRNGSIVATVIILADDITVIGVADDVGLLATLPAWGGSVIADIVLGQVIDILNEAVEEGNLDVGHTEKLVGIGAGTYAIPAECNPKMTNQLPRNGRPPSSGRLTRNLKRTGCWCEDADAGHAAHHIVPKNSEYPVGQQLLQCLENKGIDVDNAINGVCLPQAKTDKSDAFPHAGKEGKLHGKEVLTKLKGKCDSMTKEQFEDYLRQTADRYTKGLPPL